MRPLAHEAHSPDVDVFLQRVEALEARTWLEIGAVAPTDDPALAAALVRRDGALSAATLAVEAWRVRDAVLTLAWLAERRAPPIGRAGRRCLATGRERIECAALAHLVADALAPDELLALCAATSRWLPLPAPATRSATRPPTRSAVRSAGERRLGTA